MEGLVIDPLAVDPDVDVLAGDGEGGVAEYGSEHVEVHAVFVEMGGAGVAKRVGCEVAADGSVALGDSGFFAPLFHDTADLALADLKDSLLGPEVFGELGQHLGGFGIDHDVTVFVTFAVTHEDFELVEVEVGFQHALDFADAHGAGVEDPQEKIIAQFAWVVTGSPEQLVDLATGEDGGESLALPGFLVDKLGAQLGMPGFVGETELVALLSFAQRDGGSGYDLDGLLEGGLGAWEIAAEVAEGLDLVGELGDVLELLGRQTFGDTEGGEGVGWIVTHGLGLAAGGGESCCRRRGRKAAGGPGRLRLEAIRALAGHGHVGHVGECLETPTFWPWELPKASGTG